MNTQLRYPTEAYLSECHFETSRSRGKGGQAVNKIESRVTLVFNLAESRLFDINEKERIAKGMKTYVSDEVIRISSEKSRSQLQNKNLVSERFIELLAKSLIIKKKRIATKVSTGVKQQRRKSKQLKSEKKGLRKKPEW